MKTCSVDDCVRKSKAHHLCSMHYNAAVRLGDIVTTPNVRNVCSVDGCGLFCRNKGFCAKHYNRFRRWGTTRLDAPGKLVCRTPGCYSVRASRLLCGPCGDSFVSRKGEYSMKFVAPSNSFGPDGNGRLWESLGVCAQSGEDPDDWVLEGRNLSFRNELAVSKCGVCPVFDACRAATLPGIHAGTIRAGVLVEDRVVLSGDVVRVGV